MPKVCEICGGKHYAKLRCKAHYRMPSRQKSLIEKMVEVIEDYNIAQIKIRREINNAKKEKGISELIKLADIVFARWIKKRDKLNDNTFKCISCGEFKPVREMQCGHYFSRTFSALRYDEDNCNGECEKCNCFDDQHLKGYEVRLKEKIGLKRFNFLLENYNKQIKWDRQELLNLIQKYK